MDLLKNDQLKLLLCFLLFMVCSCTDGQIMLEEQLYHGFGCYGDHDEYGFINASCPSGSVIAPVDVTYGAKLRNQTTCTGYILRNNTLDYYQLCCKPENTDCLKIKETNSPYQSCTGRAACIPSIRVEWLPLTNTMCDLLQYGSVYDTSVTSYMIFKYFCVEETRVYAVSSVDATVNASIIYLWNSGYPYSQIPANTKTKCSVEMENCLGTISVITVHVSFPTGSNGTCSHSIKILTSNGEVVQTLSCAVYKNITSIYTSSDTYLYIETENLSGNQSGQFWLGFQATTSSTFHVSCPGKDRIYCLPNTTTSTSTSTTTTTTTLTPSSSTTTTTTSTTTSIPTTTKTTTKPTIQSTITTTNITVSNKSSSIPTNSNIAIIVGVVLGAVVLISIIIILWILWRKFKKRETIPPEETMIESTSLHLPSNYGVPPADHLIGTSKTRRRKHKKQKHKGEMDAENDKTGKKKKEKRRKKTKKKHRYRDHHSYDTNIQTENMDQSDLKMRHTDVGENLSVAHLDILDKTETMNRVDPVPDDSKLHHRKRKKRRREPLSVVEESEQAVYKNNRDRHGKRKKKRNKHSQKEDKSQTYAGEERLPQFQEPVHTFVNEVYPSNDPN
ncbi:hypothetical protein CHS0354_012975 [Potamilus streckersoni]|uniref:Uncharacterized protein n=1 Tax=Potamilus streckersoni TaxID=2493646 RepID=A0AAE0T8F2_9BIVA|nr:hypothetical protein CHS0354_012975 [Potamilus streckersoni]